MHAAILTLIGFLAFCATVYGAMSILAGGMSDDPMAGREAGNEGAAVGGTGLLVFLIVVGDAIWRWLA